MTPDRSAATPRTVQLKGVRAAIARKMCDSLAQAPQLSYFAEADATALIVDAAGPTRSYTPAAASRMRARVSSIEARRCRIV